MKQNLKRPVMIGQETNDSSKGSNTKTTDLRSLTKLLMFCHMRKMVHNLSLSLLLDIKYRMYAPPNQ